MYVLAILVMEHWGNAGYFSLDYFTGDRFILYTLVLLLIAVIPLSLLLFIRRKLNPPIYKKLG